MAKEPLHKIFKRMSKGNPEACAILIVLAKTAYAIDPECPHGPYGVLADVEKFAIEPADLVKLYKLCNSDVLMLNALAFAVYAKKLTSTDLKTAIDNDFVGFNPHKMLEDVRAIQPNFGIHYRPR